MSDTPVVLIHGWGGSYEQTWRRPGWDMLLADIGRTALGIDLLGHGMADKPHDPQAYADLSGWLAERLPAEPVDVVAFSLGAMTTLRLAARSPERFRRIVVAGVGTNLFTNERSTRIVDAVEGRGDTDDTEAQVFARYAHDAGNDPLALAAIMRRPWVPFTAEELVNVTTPVLVCLGDRDFAGPADPLVDALPNVTFKALRNTDHFATPEKFEFIDAALAFLGA